MRNRAGVVLAVFLAGLVYAQTADMGRLIPVLKQGGCVLLFRHGATSPDQKDVYPLNYGDMSKQRQLSEQGRDAARQVGSALKTLGIPIGTVYTSRLNRAVETGKLISGKDVIGMEALNDSGMGSMSAMSGASGGGSEVQAQALRRLLTTAPPPDTNTLVVTHKPNIQDALGSDWANVQEGEATIFRPDGSGKPAPIGRVRVDDWVKAARG